MAVRILLRGDTAAGWAAANPVLASREPGVETDTSKQKVGNGVDPWSALPYAATGQPGKDGRDGSNVVPTAEAVAYEIGTEGTPANTALSATIAEGVSASLDPARNSALVAVSDRTASLSRSQVEYADNAGWTEDWTNLTAWEAQTAVTGGFMHKGPTGTNAQRALVGLNTGNARVIGSIKVVSGGTGSNLTLIGLTRNTDSDPAGLVGDGFFAIGVTEGNIPTTFPGGNIAGASALAAGTYYVSVMTTSTEIICTLYSEDAATYYRYSYGRQAWGESYRVGVYNSDSRNAAGNLVGPIAARIDYASAKPRGTVETRNRWTRYDVNGDNVLVATPKGYDSRKPQPWVIYAHGYGDTEEKVTTQDTAMRPALTALLDAGYAVAAPNFGGASNWGNPTALASMKNVYRHLRDRYNVGPVILVGHSMGGLVTLTATAEGTIPGLAGWVGVEPVVSLESMYSHPSVAEYRTTISDAYGIAADGSDYGSKTGGFDPALRAGHDFGSVPMLVFASPADTAVLKSENADVLAAKAGITDLTLIETSGGHIDPSHFQPAQVVAFADRVTKG